MSGAVITIKGLPPAMARTAGTVIHTYLRGMAGDVTVEVSADAESAVATLTDIREFLVEGFHSRVLFLKPLGRSAFDVQMV